MATDQVRLQENTYLSNAVEVTYDKAKYDASIKEVLADKQILARILKYSLEEFAEYDIEEIIRELDEPVVSRVRMEPGQTNASTSKVQKTSEEDTVPGEGQVFYDIRFSVFHGVQKIKILINIEAQMSTKKSKLHYELDNRTIYYLGRMISAQKEVEFAGSNYDDLKHVRSIWICMDGADDEDSISRICLRQEPVFGKPADLHNLDKVVGVMIRLRANENVEESKNKLISMLEELLRKEAAHIKKKKLADKYGLIMTRETERRVSEMCNWSEAIAEREYKKGLKSGIERGIEQGEGRLNELNRLLVKNDRIDDMIKATTDEAFRMVLYAEFQL